MKLNATLYFTLCFSSLLVSYGGFSFLMGDWYSLRVQNALTELAMQPEASHAALLDQLDGDINKLIFWDAWRGESQALVATYYLHKASITSGEEQSRLYAQTLEVLREAQVHQPYGARLYVQEAEVLWRMGARFAEIMTALTRAQSVAPYDREVALLSFEFYLAHSTRLNDVQQQRLEDYLFRFREYRVPRHRLNMIIARSPDKQLACELLSNANQKIKACNGR
ncbi:hypothetical protein D0812_24240 [Vibrio owensii]|uniref:Uncharacterized protein n=1 Tax=Vibrio owensii TaxID=696485 RepID=A0AAP9GGL5_9VIBR|nr:hypothetical protein [Vibrio owensii]AYO17477.1 hypothetical protein D0812_24240 [Vibrio owensii]QGH49619.1 hypothetical protein APZ19_21230 [Vibrio owensii]